MPQGSEIQIEKLFIYNAHATRRVADIYIGNGSNPERQHQKLLILIDGPHSAAFTAAIIDDILERAVKTFQTSRHITPELILESVLETLNISIAELIPSKLGEVLESLTCLIALSDRGQVHFSQIGSIQALLFQSNTATLVSEEVKEINPFKLFAHITSGILNPGDTLLFTTPSLIDYISENKIKTLVASYPPQFVIEQLESLLRQAPPTVLFASVFIKFTTELDELAAQRRPSLAMTQTATSAPSDETLIEEEYEPAPPRRTPSRRSHRMDFSILERGLAGVGPILLHILYHGWYFIQILWQGLRQLFLLVRATTMSLLRPDTRAKYEKQLEGFTNHELQSLRSHLKAVTKMSRTLLIGILLIVFVLVHILILRGQDIKLREAAARYETILQTASEKKSEVKNLGLYKDEQRAEQLLLEIDQLLNELQPRSPLDKEMIAKYREDNDNDLRAIRHINLVEKPLAYKDLSSELNNGAISALAMNGAQLWVTNNTTLFAVSDKAVTQTAQASQPIRSLMQSSENNSVYALTTDGLQMLQDKIFKTVSLPRNSQNKKTDAVQLYVTNLYSLDSGAHAIFKHNGSKLSYQVGTVWAQDEQLSDANDFAVDGSIYVIKSNGSIIKYTRGDGQRFNYHALVPSLGTKTKIYTNKDLKYLYILDPQNKRVVILSKDGSIINQYISPAFDTLGSLAVNEKDNTLYIANGSIIYAVVINKPLT